MPTHAPSGAGGGSGGGRGGLVQAPAYVSAGSSGEEGHLGVSEGGSGDEGGGEDRLQKQLRANLSKLQ